MPQAFCFIFYRLCSRERGVVSLVGEESAVVSVFGETFLGVTEYTVRAADEAACADIEAAE